MATARTPLADYLRARRALVTPEDAGLPRDAGRRVAGLKREEVAALAGISTEYYHRLEQGRDSQPSDQVLSALARALQLDAYGRAYLLRLGRQGLGGQPSTMAEPTVTQGVGRLLEQWSQTPAYVVDRNQDVLAVNTLASVLAPDTLVPGSNLVVSTFESAALAGEHSEAWYRVGAVMVAALRFSSDPFDPRLHEIVGSLSVRHPRFRTIWARQDAKPQTSGNSRVLVQPFGWVEYDWQTLEVPGTRGQFLTTWTGEPGSPAVAAFAYLAARSAPPAVPSAIAASATRVDSSSGRHTTSVSS